MLYKVAACCILMLILFGAGQLYAQVEIKPAIGSISQYAVHTGKFKAGQTVSASVNVKNKDAFPGNFFLSLNVTDPLGNVWPGEMRRLIMHGFQNSTYSVSWKVPDDAPTGSYSARISLSDATPGGNGGELDSAEVQDAFTVILSGGTHFIAVFIEKDTGKPVSPPVSLSILETSGEYARKNYTIIASANPARMSTDWFASNTEGTVISITAIKNGYNPSESFLYPLPASPPTSGRLFNHTFVLEKSVEKVQKEILPTKMPKAQSVRLNDAGYATIITTSDLTGVKVDQQLKKIIFTFEEKADKGSANITLPKTVIVGPFQVNRHEVLFNQNATHYSFYFEYGKGPQSIEVTGSTLVPEFPLGSSLVIATVFSLSIAISIFIRKRTEHSMHHR